MQIWCIIFQLGASTMEIICCGSVKEACGEGKYTTTRNKCSRKRRQNNEDRRRERNVERTIGRAIHTHTHTHTFQNSSDSYRFYKSLHSHSQTHKHTHILVYLEVLLFTLHKRLVTKNTQNTLMILQV